MKTALIIEPDSRVRLFLMRVAGRRGWCVTAVENAEAGFAALAQTRRDVVFIDWHAEDGAGLLILSLMKDLPACRETHFVMTHRGVCDELALIAHATGAAGCLIKPTLGECAWSSLTNSAAPASTEKGRETITALLEKLQQTNA